MANTKPLSAKAFANMALFVDDEEDDDPREIQPTRRLPPATLTLSGPPKRTRKQSKRSKPEDFDICTDSSEGEPENNFRRNWPAPLLDDRTIMIFSPLTSALKVEEEPKAKLSVPMQFLSNTETFKNKSATVPATESTKEGMVAPAPVLPTKRKRGTGRHALLMGAKKRKYTWKNGTAPERRLGHVTYPEGHKFAKFNKCAKKAVKQENEEGADSKGAKEGLDDEEGQGGSDFEGKDTDFGEDDDLDDGFYFP